VTLTLGGAIFIAVFSVRTSLFNTLSLANQYNDFDVSLELSREYRVDQIRQEAFQVPGVTAVETWGSATAVRQRPDGSESDRYRLNAPAYDTTMIRPNMLEGRWLLPDDQSALVVNSNFVKEEPDVRVGSQVTLDVGGKNSEWTVVGVVHSVLSLPTVYANYPYFAELTGTTGRSSFARVSVEPDDAEAQKRAAEALKAHFDDAGYQVSRTESRAVDQESVGTQFNILITFLLIMALLIALVGGIGLMGTMSINVLERTREIGVLRAIGASDAALIVIILVEGVLIGMISWVQGAILALPIGRLMSDQVGRAFVDSPLEYGYSVQGALLWLGTAAVIAAVASLLPARNAARLTVREVLSYE
jgi:putative ABC transport system permease protein